MKVDGINLRQVLNTYGNNKARPGKPTNNSDKLEVGNLYKYVENAKEVKLPHNPRIEEIKTGIKNNTYDIPSENVAQKMIDDVLLSMKIKRGGAR